MSDNSYSTELSPEERERRARILAEEMWAVIREKGWGEYFWFQPDTPISVLKRAIEIFAATDHSGPIIQRINLIHEPPVIWLGRELEGWIDIPKVTEGIKA